MPNTGLSEFKEVLSDFRQLGSLALKGLVAAPLVDIWLKLGPPPPKMIGTLTSLTEFIAVVWVFQFWYKSNERELGIRMRVAIALFCIGIVSSVFLLERFTTSPGQGREKVIEGLSLRPEVKRIVNSSYTPEEALKESEYDPEAIWTKESIALLQTLITIVWMATFACLAIYLTVFIILQRRRHSGMLAHQSFP